MDFTWQKDELQELLSNICETLDQHGELATPSVVEKVENNGGWSEDYMRNLLVPQALDELKERGEVTVSDKRREGGNPTIYWSLTDR